MAADGVAFGLMCKVPEAGTSKTRLCPPLSGDEAAALSACFIADVAASIAAALPAVLGARGIAVHAPAGDGAALHALLPAEFTHMGQRGAGLGERILHAVEDLLAVGHRGVCLINADSPTLPPALLVRAALVLAAPGDPDGERLVLGPAIDGGYYLIGLKRPHPALFSNIAWSTGRVLGQTLAAAADLGLPVTLLPAWYDVDDDASLQLLLNELFGGGIPLAADGISAAPAAHTRRYLQQLFGTAPRGRFAFIGLDR